MRPESRRPLWTELESKCHLHTVQAIIRREIANGTIRVVPAADGGIRILPVGVADATERSERVAAVESAADAGYSRPPVLRIERIAEAGIIR